MPDNKLAILIIQAIEIYSYVMLIWVIGSWFPQLHSSRFYQAIDKIVYPYAKIFRSVIPPIGGFDFSVIVAFLVLGLVQKLLSSFLI